MIVCLQGKKTNLLNNQQQYHNINQYEFFTTDYERITITVYPFSQFYTLRNYPWETTSYTLIVTS